jgi:hypothetical protein
MGRRYCRTRWWEGVLVTIRPSRRRFLGVVGAGATTGAVGCVGRLSGDQGACSEGTIGVEGPNGTTSCVEPVESDQSVAEYVGYDTENNFSTDTPDEVERKDATVTFVYRNSSTDELSLVVIHDEPTDTTTGKASMSFDGVAGSEWQVRDDPENVNPPDRYQTDESTMDETESVVWQWGSNPRTDGGAVGPLDEAFDVTITHRQSGTVDDVSVERSGLDRWLVVDGADLGNPVELATFDDDTGDVSARLYVP